LAKAIAFNHYLASLLHPRRRNEYDIFNSITKRKRLSAKSELAFDRLLFAICHLLVLVPEQIRQLNKNLPSVVEERAAGAHQAVESLSRRAGETSANTLQ